MFGTTCKAYLPDILYYCDDLHLYFILGYRFHGHDGLGLFTNLPDAEPQELLFETTVFQVAPEIMVGSQPLTCTFHEIFSTQ